MAVKILSKPIIILTILTLIFFSVTSLHANQNSDSNDNSIILFLLDINAIKGDLENQNLLNSLISISSVVNQNHKMYFSVLDSSSSEIAPQGPYIVNRNFENMYDDIEKLITNHEYQKTISLDINESLLNSYNFLQSQFAENDSKIIFIGGSQVPLLMSNANSEDVLKEFVDPVADLYSNKKWEILGISLKDAHESILILLNRYSKKTLSENLKFSLPNILNEFSIAISKDIWSSGEIIDHDNLEISNKQIYNSEILISPGTSLINLFFYKNKTGGSFRLKNPSGMQSTAGDRSESSIIETPYSIIWQIKNPIPGKWNVEINNYEGQIQSFLQPSYEYQLELLNLNSKNAINQPLSLITFITDQNDVMVNLDHDISIQVSIIDPTGIETLYQMNDEGLKADAVKDDGYYSLEIPKINTLGTHKMSLQMKWQGFESDSLISNHEFESIFFPYMNFEELNISNLNIGNESNLGTLYVSIGDTPYPVDQKSINTTILTNSNQISDSYTLIPRRSTTDGKSAMYDVIYTPQEIGNTLITFNMNIDYAGRLYEVPAQSIQIQIVKIPTTFSIMQISGIVLFSLLLIIGIIILLAIIYRNLQTAPYGHLNDENGNLIVNFKTIKKPLIQQILHRDEILGTVIGITGLEEITLKYKNGLVIMNISDDSSRIRINSQPVVNSYYLKDGDWIGTSGKLYEFVINP